MKNNILSIARKELARFFSNKATAAVAILLPGLLIFAMWSLMGNALSNMAGGNTEEGTTIASIGLPATVAALSEGANVTFEAKDSLSNAAQIRESIKNGEYAAFVVFPADFDKTVAAYDPSKGSSAPQVEIYYDSTDTASNAAYMLLTSFLNTYESSIANRFDVNAGDAAYDVSDEKSRASQIIVSIVPMVLLMLLFSGCMSVATEAIAGEKERGTMTTLLATPIKRSDIALGKILALTLIGLMVAASSAIGLFASLPNLTMGELDINIYGPAEYSFLALIILSTTLFIVMIISVLSAIAKTTKEAQLYLTPVMVVVMAVGLLGMFNGTAQTDLPFYLIPLYNSIQCMIGIFTFDFQPINIVACVVSNLVYTGVGVFVLQRMFHSERLMFAR